MEIETDELQAIVDRQAARLGRSVAIDDPNLRLFVASRHFGDEDPARIRVMLSRQTDQAIVEYAESCGISRSEQPVRLAARADLGLRPRVCVPVRWSRQLLGFLWLIDPDGSLAEEDIGQAVTAAEAASMVLYRRLLLHEHERRRRGALLRDLVSADPAARARAQDEIADSGAMAATGQVALACVNVISPAGSSGPAEARAALSAACEEACRFEPADRIMIQSQARRALLLYAAPSPVGAAQEPLVALVGHVLRVFSSSGHGAFRAVAGVGSCQPGLDGCPVSYRQARAAARAAGLLQGFGPVASWDSLGVYALLLQLPQRQLTMDLCPPGLLKLVNSDRSRRLLETAETYLDCAGDTARAAEVLHIHRTTLQYRLGRIQALSGFDLANGSDRLSLHLGAKLLQLTGAYEPPGQPAARGRGGHDRPATLTCPGSAAGRSQLRQPGARLPHSSSGI
jgi:sugar diacid utilization regulator